MLTNRARAIASACSRQLSAALTVETPPCYTRCASKIKMEISG